MTKEIIASVLGLISVGGGGWGANEYLHRSFAAKDAVVVAGTKADYVLDRQMMAVLREINRIEDRPVKSPEDLDTLKYLRELLKEMREVRRGKK